MRSAVHPTSFPPLSFFNRRIPVVGIVHFAIGSLAEVPANKTFFFAPIAAKR